MLDNQALQAIRKIGRDLLENHNPNRTEMNYLAVYHLAGLLALDGPEDQICGFDAQDLLEYFLCNMSFSSSDEDQRLRAELTALEPPSE